MTKRVAITEWQTGVADKAKWPLGAKDASYRGRVSEYSFVRFESPGIALFDNGEGVIERFAARAGGVSGWHLRYRGTSWEFVSTTAEAA